MPELTLKALAAHDEFGDALHGDADAMLSEFAKVDIDTDRLASELLGEGVESFRKSWRDLLTCIASKAKRLKAA
jgi:transaldolase